MKAEKLSTIKYRQQKRLYRANKNLNEGQRAYLVEIVTSGVLSEEQRGHAARLLEKLNKRLAAKEKLAITSDKLLADFANKPTVQTDSAPAPSREFTQPEPKSAICNVPLTDDEIRRRYKLALEKRIAEEKAERLRQQDIEQRYWGQL
jgi:hypothetical protein